MAPCCPGRCQRRPSPERSRRSAAPRPGPPGFTPAAPPRRLRGAAAARARAAPPTSPSPGPGRPPTPCPARRCAGRCRRRSSGSGTPSRLRSRKRRRPRMVRGKAEVWRPAQMACKSSGACWPHHRAPPSGPRHRWWRTPVKRRPWPKPWRRTRCPWGSGRAAAWWARRCARPRSCTTGPWSSRRRRPGTAAPPRACRWARSAGSSAPAAGAPLGSCRRSRSSRLHWKRRRPCWPRCLRPAEARRRRSKARRGTWKSLWTA
mmetsp:Transcript_47057/g.111774  ORF Transcript_47057/g.111774 Transcript_47057/m.111774 type:complete len:261 (-) Transcript_47057:199-981(-)